MVRETRVVEQYQDCWYAVANIRIPRSHPVLVLCNSFGLNNAAAFHDVG